MALNTNLYSLTSFVVLLTVVAVLPCATFALQVQQTTESLHALPKPSTIPFGIRLAFADPATDSNASSGNSLTVTWSTTTPLVQLPCVELFHPIVAENQEFLHSSRRQGPVNLVTTVICGSSTTFIEPATQEATHFIHTVLLDNLQPDKTLAKYQYKCGNDVDGWSQVHSFRPPPPPGGGGGSSSGSSEGSDNTQASSTNFLLIGDMGVAHALTLPDLIKDATLEDESNYFSALLHVGDIAYDLHHYDGRKGQHFLRMIEPISASIPYMVAPGNHEAAFNFSHYRSFFKMPKYEISENLYYSFDMGLVHIVVYNTEVFFWPESYGVENMSTMFEWLEEDLRKANKNRKQVPWILVVGHRPMYCSSLPLPLETPLSTPPLSGKSGNTATSDFLSGNGNLRNVDNLEFLPHCGWEAEASRRGIPSICPHNNPRFCHRLKTSQENEEEGEVLSSLKSENCVGTEKIKSDSPTAKAKTFPIEELFKKYSVDMFVAGHVHDYERYWPVYNYTYTTYTTNKEERKKNPKIESPQPIEATIYSNPNATVHIISGAGGNSEMRIGPGLPPQGPCSTETPWCAYQSGHGPAFDQGYDFSYSRVFVHNASHLQWQQVSTTFDRVIDEFWVVEDHGIHQFS